MSLRGLEAINSAHGLSVTVVGIITVFLGLFGLFVILSELHKVILLWENRSGLFTKFNFFKNKKTFPGCGLLKNSPPSVIEEAKQLYILAKFIGEEFSLSQLLELAKKRNLAISKPTIKILIDNGIIIPIDKGRYYWREEDITTG